MAIARRTPTLLYLASLLTMIAARYATSWWPDAPLATLSVEASTLALLLFPNALLVFVPSAHFELAFAVVAIAGLVMCGWFEKSLARTAFTPRVLIYALGYALLSLTVFMLAFAYAMRGLALPRV